MQSQALPHPAHSCSFCNSRGEVRVVCECSSTRVQIQTRLHSAHPAGPREN